MHKYSFLRTNQPFLCIFIKKYLYNTQKSVTFADVFCPKLNIGK